jgi:hypothetical protein
VPRSKEESKKSPPMKCALTQNLQVKGDESIDVEVLDELHSSTNKHRFRASGSKVAKEDKRHGRCKTMFFDFKQRP